jgi:rare lipoprotein A
MTKHFVVVIVAVYAILAAASHGAAAGSPLYNHGVQVPSDRSAWISESGQASYYGPACNGRRSASGALFNQMALTAAHPWLPFGTKVRVILAGTHRSVIVTITDRLHYRQRILDLSVGAARELGMIGQGVAQVTLAPA